ncbi:hypothetical protein [Maridesulfovibrio sp.]|uniref:hypothetical protein n=1 Tax=Maridesulfovibrio sp. TaxID=2795000 RepID=UPI0039EE8494
MKSALSRVNRPVLLNILCLLKSKRGPQTDYSQWKRFVEGRDVDLKNLDEAIVDSWNRCKSMNVEHAPRSCWDFLPCPVGALHRYP